MRAYKSLDEEAIPAAPDNDDKENDEQANPLPPRQERALCALLTCSTQKDAALAAGISEPTLWRYMNDPAFKRRLREAQRHALTQTALRVQRGAGDAVSVLYEIMTKGDASDSARISAARFFFENSFRIGEIEELKTQMEDLQELYRVQQESDVIAAFREEGDES
jgi:hypothetical protein